MMTNLITLCQSVAACRWDAWFFMTRLFDRVEATGNVHYTPLCAAANFAMLIFRGSRPSIVRINGTFSSRPNLWRRGKLFIREMPPRRPPPFSPRGARIKFRRIEILYYCGNGAVRNFIWSNVHARLTTNTETEKKRERERLAMIKRGGWEARKN